MGAFDTFSSDDILRGGKWKGKALPAEVLGSMKAEAANLKQSQLWKVLKAELQWFALKSLIERGESADDIRFARAIGNVVQELDKKLDELAESVSVRGK